MIKKQRNDTPIFNGYFQLFSGISFVYLTVLIYIYIGYTHRCIEIHNSTVITQYVNTEQFVNDYEETYYIHKLYIVLKYTYESKSYTYHMYVGMNTFEGNNIFTRRQFIKDTVSDNPNQYAIGSTSEKNRFWIRVDNPELVFEYNCSNISIVFIISTVIYIYLFGAILVYRWLRKFNLVTENAIEERNLKKV